MSLSHCQILSHVVLFDMILDVMGRGIKEQPPWCMLFADDIVLCSTRRDLEEWRTATEEPGLKISRRKTEYLGCNEHQDAEIQLQGETLKRVKTFTYLGSTLAEYGELDAEVTHRVQSGWKNWKRVSGVLCDRRMNMKIKGKVYRTVVRPALMYGAETWALKKAQENKLEVAEMRMLRWMCGVTKLDKIRNERIRGTTKVGEITKKVQERRLKWYGYVMRREEHYVGRRAMVMKEGREEDLRLRLVREDGWTKRRDCRLMMCMTELHGGVCHRTSTPHKSGNKMKDKKKKSRFKYYRF